MGTTALLWRRIDLPGHDACRFWEDGSGWEIDGTAVFLQRRREAAGTREPVPPDEGAVTRLAYRVVGDASWRTQHGTVHGFIGTDPVDLTITRTPAGEWTVNGELAPGLEGCVHLDFGFTPATNFPQLRDIALESDGQTAELSVAWLDVPAAVLQVLPQRYQRRSQHTFWYEAPTVPYAALLEVTDGGFIRRYPGLWEIEGG